MAKDDVIELEGIVVDALPNAMFTVDIPEPDSLRKKVRVRFCLLKFTAATER